MTQTRDWLCVYECVCVRERERERERNRETERQRDRRTERPRDRERESLRDQNIPDHKIRIQLLPEHEAGIIRFFRPPATRSHQRQGPFPDFDVARKIV